MNHGIGERNLCMSALDEMRRLILPKQSGARLIYMTYENGVWVPGLQVQKNIDFTQAIYDQLPPGTVLLNDNNCRF